jgi:hypothetical protein
LKERKRVGEEVPAHNFPFRLPLFRSCDSFSPFIRPYLLTFLLLYVLSYVHPPQGYSDLIRETIGEAISKGVPAEHAARYSVVRTMRGVKRAVLRLIETFAERCEPGDRHLLLPLVPPLITPVLGDYQNAQPEDAKEADVLSCLAALIEKTRELFQPFVGAVLQSTFEVRRTNDTVLY